MSKQCLDVHQMQHLQEMGLDTSNASMLYCDLYDEEYILVESKHRFDKEENAILLEGVRNSVIYCKKVTPAYTLQDVLDALPIEIKYKDKRCWLCIELADEMIGYYYENARFEHRWVYHEVVMIDESLIDAAYRLLIWVIENGYISKLPANKNSK